MEDKIDMIEKDERLFKEAQKILDKQFGLEAIEGGEKKEAEQENKFTEKDAKRLARYVIDQDKTPLMINDCCDLMYLDNSTGEWTPIEPGTEIYVPSGTMVSGEMETSHMTSGEAWDFGETQKDGVTAIVCDDNGNLIIVTEDAVLTTYDIEDQILDIEPEYGMEDIAHSGR
jgi:hypothetical protein